MKSWYAKNPAISFLDLLYALEQHKSISTEYGLNVSIEQHWRFGDPHKKTAEPDRHDYEIAMVNGIETPPGPDWHKLYRWLVSQSSAFLPYHTVYLVTDNRDLQSDEVKSVHGLSHWPMVAAWWKERLRYVGPYGELTTVVFVHISADTVLHKVHPTWAGTFILDACVFLFPTINFALIDSDCVPVTSLRYENFGLRALTQPDQLHQAKLQRASCQAPLRHRTNVRALLTREGTCSSLVHHRSYLDRIVRTILLSEKLTHHEPLPSPMVPIWQTRLTMVIRQTRVPACLGGRRLAAMTLPRLGQPNLPGRTNQTWMKLPVRAGPKESSL